MTRLASGVYLAELRMSPCFAVERRQVGADDGEVNVGDLLDGFELHHDLAGDYEIQPMHPTSTPR
jgi:hypothetical protein